MDLSLRMLTVTLIAVLGLALNSCSEERITWPVDQDQTELLEKIRSSLPEADIYVGKGNSTFKNGDAIPAVYGDFDIMVSLAEDLVAVVNDGNLKASVARQSITNQSNGYEPKVEGDILADLVSNLPEKISGYDINGSHYEVAVAMPHIDPVLKAEGTYASKWDGVTPGWVAVGIPTVHNTMLAWSLTDKKWFEMDNAYLADNPGWIVGVTKIGDPGAGGNDGDPERLWKWERCPSGSEYQAGLRGCGSGSYILCKIVVLNIITLGNGDCSSME